MPNETHLELWYTALRSPLGIAVRSARPEAASQALYRSRRDAADVALDAISIIRSPTDPQVLWLTKRGT